MQYTIIKVQIETFTFQMSIYLCQLCMLYLFDNLSRCAWIGCRVKVVRKCSTLYTTRRAQSTRWRRMTVVSPHIYAAIHKSARQCKLITGSLWPRSRPVLVTVLTPVWPSGSGFFAKMSRERRWCSVQTTHNIHAHTYNMRFLREAKMCKMCSLLESAWK